MYVTTVSTRKDMAAFVRLPKDIHKGEACYVPPIWMDEAAAYTGKKNPILSNSDFVLLLARADDGTAVGRTIVYIDHTFNKYYKTKMGFFGAFDCIDDDEAGAALVDAAEAWLKQRGMSMIRGPIHPVAECWGFVYGDYERPPVYMAPWNPAYYHRFFGEYSKAKDLLVYEADMRSGYTLPARFDNFIERFSKRYPSITIRRLNMRHIKDDARAIWEITNTALAHNWGFVPLELPVMEDMLSKLKLVVDPDAVFMVEDGGKPVGYCLGFPDINILLKRIKGRLLPFGWARLIFGAKKLHDYRLFGLAVHPDWHGKALDALMYIHLQKHLAPKRVRLEANYILEDNLHIRNALERLGLTKINTYRIYEKAL